MELTAAITIVTALAATIVPAIVARPGMTPSRKRGIAVAIAAVLGAVVAVATGQVPEVPADVVHTLSRAIVIAGVVISLAQGFDRAFKDALSNLERRTSPEVDDTE